MGAGGGGVFWITAAEGFFGFSVGTGTGGGATTVAAAGGAGCTSKLLTTVLTPGSWPTSPLAMVRTVSLVTVPVRVTTPPLTEAWTDWPLRLGSEMRRFWIAVLRLASSVAGGAVLHPARRSARESAMDAVRGVEKMVWAFMASSHYRLALLQSFWKLACIAAPGIRLGGGLPVGSVPCDITDPGTAPRVHLRGVPVCIHGVD